jgi:hypothetical protein
MCEKISHILLCNKDNFSIMIKKSKNITFKGRLKTIFSGFQTAFHYIEAV